MGYKDSTSGRLKRSHLHNLLISRITALAQVLGPVAEVSLLRGGSNKSSRIDIPYGRRVGKVTYSTSVLDMTYYIPNDNKCLNDKLLSVGASSELDVGKR